MKASAEFDLHKYLFIHFAVIFLCLWALASACSESKHPDAKHPDAKHPDAKHPVARDTADGPLADAETDEKIPDKLDSQHKADNSIPPLDQESKRGIFRADDKVIALEVGSAHKGPDVSLCRQAASSRARTNLLLLLKSKNLVNRDTMSLSGVTVKRFWIEKGEVFALAKYELKNIPEDLNVRGSIPSNASEDTRKGTATPKGGAEK